MEKYINAKFLVQSVMVLDPSKRRGRGQIYVVPHLENVFGTVRDFERLEGVVYSGSRIQLSDSSDPILKAIVSRIKKSMYDGRGPNRRGKVIIPQKFRKFDHGLLEEARDRGHYLTLDKLVTINPSAWGELPAKPFREVNVRPIPGNNVTGHYLPPSQAHGY